MRNCQPFRSFQLTRSVGSVTIQQAIINEYIYISTHTLRGERDIQRYDKRTARHTFQLTRSVGSVTFINNFSFITVTISTHTLREERDYELVVFGDLFRISTNTLRGERDGEHKNNIIEAAFQLTRSVGSVTLHIVYVKSHHHNRADILLKITLKIDIFYIICIIFSANLHIKPISLHVRSQNQTALRVICFLCTYMLHSPLPIITQIIESKAILFFINNFHKSIF